MKSCFAANNVLPPCSVNHREQILFLRCCLEKRKKKGELVLMVIDNNVKESKSETAEYLLVRLKLESERLLRK